VAARPRCRCEPLGLQVRISPGEWISEIFLGVVCCQVEVTSTVRSLVQRNTTESEMSECDRETTTMRRLGPTKALEP